MSDRLESVLADFLRRTDAGERVDRDALVAEHPELAGDLRSFFGQRDAIEKVAAPLRAAAGNDASTIGLGARPGSVADGSGLNDEPPSQGRFGDYELLEEIARGGMGVVYKARQVSLNRSVAIKMILSGRLASAAEVQRFRHEAEAAAALDHPAIVPIYEVGEHRGRHYFSMGLVEGKSLAERLIAGPLETEEAARLVAQIARAVHFAHDRGVIHRDLKPSNILLDAAGRPKVTDFGLARHASRDASLTATGEVLGTPSYMPPEQAEGRSERIGPATDVYALGAILYAAVTGRPPFQAATPVDTILQVIAAEPVAPQQLNPSVPEDLDTIILKCLEKRGEYRYPSAAALADDLDRYVAGEPIQARPPGLVERARRWLAKQQQSLVVASAAAAVGVLLVVGSLLAMTFLRQSREGKLSLDTDHSRLVARLFPADGPADPERTQPLTDPVTVPTQTPLVVPAGEYRLAASGRELLSDEILIAVERGHETKLKLKLDDRILWPEVAVPGWCEILPTRGDGEAASVLLLDGKGLVYRMPDANQEWTLNLETHPKLAGLGGPWWLKNVLYFNQGYGKYDSRPGLMRPAPRLDDDEIGEVVLSLRQRPALVAISPQKKDVLWVYTPAGYEEILAVREALVAKAGGSADGIFSGTVIGEPVAVDDLDGDGAPDLVAAFVQATPATTTPRRILRSVEGISGRTGARLWSYPLPEEWFALPPTVDAPQASLWFAAYPTASGGGGDNNAYYGNVMRNQYHDIPTGDSHVVPYPALAARIGGKPAIAVAAGTRVVTLDPATGQPLRQPDELGYVAVAPPRLADVDGDQSDELILVEQVGPPTRGSRSGTPQWPPKHRLTAWSLARGEPLWAPREQTADFEKHLRTFELPPDWPIAADLNGDGRCELLSPSGSSTFETFPSGPAPAGQFIVATGTSTFKLLLSGPAQRAWGGLEMIDGTTGKVLWERQLDTADTQVDRLLPGPDLDGDGWREVFVATLFARGADRPAYLYLDALSGKDGTTLWSSRRPLRLRTNHLELEVLSPLAWTDPGSDGWPRLVVPLTDCSTGLAAQLFLFSAGTGDCTGDIPNLPAPRIVDGDGDGTRDLLFAIPTDISRPHAGGRLLSFCGASPTLWRRLGGEWQPGDDYDGDGQADVISRMSRIYAGGPTLAAVSGRTGRELWRLMGEYGQAAHFIPLGADLNGEGVPDIVGHDGHQGGGATPVFAAYSGANGRILWRAEFATLTVDRTSLVEARDLEGDGRPEVVTIAATNDTGIDLTKTRQELLVFEGATGKLRWRHALSELVGQQLQGHIARIASIDLNGDKVQDLIATAVLDNGRELHALDGRTGNLLWSTKLADTSDDRRHQQLLAPWPAASDLDGDGRPEVILTDFPEIASPQGGTTRQMRVEVFDGRSGKPKPGWPVTRPTGHQFSGLTHGSLDPLRQRPFPQVLSLAGGERGICAWKSDTWETGSIHVFQPDGQERWRLDLDQRLADIVVPHAGDLNGDGSDDVVILYEQQLQLLDGRNGRPIWKHPIGQRATIVAVRPASMTDPGLAIVLAGRRVLGIEGRTGKLLWSVDGLPAEYTSSRQNTTRLLPASGANVPWCVLTQAGDEDTLGLQGWPADKKSPELAALRAPARIEPGVADTRYERELPWVAFHTPFEGPFYLMSGLILAPLLIMLPGWFLYQAGRRRRWSLAGWMMVPAVVLLFLVGLTLPLPEDRPNGLSLLEARFLVALLMVPVLMFAYWVVRAVAAGDWTTLFWYLRIAIFATLGAAGMSLWMDRGGDPREHYVLGGWWLIGLEGLYGVALIAFIYQAFTWVVHHGRALLRRRDRMVSRSATA